MSISTFISPLSISGCDTSKSASPPLLVMTSASLPCPSPLICSTIAAEEKKVNYEFSLMTKGQSGHAATTDIAKDDSSKINVPAAQKAGLQLALTCFTGCAWPADTWYYLEISTIVTGKPQHPINRTVANLWSLFQY